MMETGRGTGPYWAVLTVWVVVNAVSVLQAVGFLSRVQTTSTAINHRIGYAIMALAIPAAVALTAFIRAGAPALHIVGPAVFLAFVALTALVDYARPIEFRSPSRPGILVPYLVLFFGGILLMGLPMFRIDRRLWFVTVATSVGLCGSMIAAMRAGVG